MKSLILAATVAFAALFVVAAPAHAQECCPKPTLRLPFFCCAKKVSTVEVCRRCYTKTVCVLGCPKIIEYAEVTYCTLYCNGETKHWTKTYRI